MRGLVCVATLVALAFPLAAQDGARYPVPAGVIVHTATKVVVSGVTYAGLRELGLSRPLSTVLATAGVLVIAKGVELGKGHRLGRLDTVHDGGAHVLGVAVARRSWRALGVSMSVVVVLCRQSSPRWC